MWYNNCMDIPPPSNRPTLTETKLDELEKHKGEWMILSRHATPHSATTKRKRAIDRLKAKGIADQYQLTQRGNVIFIRMIDDED